MSIIKTRIFFCLFTAFLSHALMSQDPVFSQFYASPVRLNVAFTGVSEAPRFSANYRTQHTGFPQAYTTIAASYEQSILHTPSSFGIRMMSDRQLEDTYINTDVALVYSYNIQINDLHHVRLGLSGGLLSSKLDFDRLTFGDVLDPIDGPTGTTEEDLEHLSLSAADFGAGVLYYGPDFYAGISFDHINQPNESLTDVGSNLYAGRPQRISLHGGVQINIRRYSNRSRPAYITPNILYATQGGFQQLNAGAYMGYGDFMIGGWYRHAFSNADGFIVSTGFRKDILWIGLSYDAVLSELRSVPGGLGPTLEASIMIDLGQSKALQRKRFSQRYNDCLNMFR